VRRPHRLLLLAVLTLGVEGAGCDRSSPSTRPVNHYPVMTSLTVHPTNIVTSDSAVVTCVATDQDGDTLVYDWQTDLRLRIRGTDLPIKSNTYNNAEWFYPNYLPTQVDTVWVFCGVRDSRGGVAGRVVTFTVHP